MMEIRSIDDDDLVVCNKQAVGPMEIVRIRSNKEKEDLNKKAIPEEERGSVGDVELKFTKKFMKFQVSVPRIIFFYGLYLCTSDV